MRRDKPDRRIVAHRGASKVRMRRCLYLAAERDRKRQNYRENSVLPLSGVRKKLSIQ
jgi:glycerophosphoryl diester phosphodiesterase